MNIERKYKLNLLTISIGMALSLGQGAAQAHFKPLSGLNGPNGFVINGVSEGDFSAVSVSAAGDINGDGIGDVIIGAKGAGSLAGASYVVFGSQQKFPSPLNLSTLDGSNGLVINGANPGDSSGFSVSAAGDINGDGFDDVIIGAINGTPNGSNSGASYVVFGSDKGLPNPLNLSALDVSSGVVINGVSADDYSGFSVSAAGDINGDGIDDLIIGAPYASPNGSNSGASYVVFGSSQGLASTIELSALNGTNGFVMNGGNGNDYAGGSVSAAGDINGDGIDDLAIGARGVDSTGSNSGASYVVFGSKQAFAGSLELSSLNGTNGFVINGESASDNLGRSVSNAGDINGDGIDDLIIGAPYAEPAGSFSGASYVVFGSEQVFPNILNLSTIDGTNGIVINGAVPGSLSGRSVSATGDINGDDIDDLIIGAPGTFVFGGSPGTSYVVFGSKQNFPHPLSLADLNGSAGFVFNGVEIGDKSGGSVSAAGDVNGDGTNDLIIGADGADPNGNNSGASYVVFGIDEIFADSFE